MFIRKAIEWNVGKNLTEKVMKKKAKKGAKNTKPVAKTEQCESFFNFFSPPRLLPEDDVIDQEVVAAFSCYFTSSYASLLASCSCSSCRICIVQSSRDTYMGAW